MVPDQTGVPVLPVTNVELLVPATSPVPTGKPVHEVSTPAVGVPKAGVVKLGDTFPAKFPVPEAPDKPKSI
jgi:hypothetical protein